MKNEVDNSINLAFPTNLLVALWGDEGNIKVNDDIKSGVNYIMETKLTKDGYIMMVYRFIKKMTYKEIADCMYLGWYDEYYIRSYVKDTFKSFRKDENIKRIMLTGDIGSDTSKPTTGLSDLKRGISVGELDAIIDLFNTKYDFPNNLIASIYGEEQINTAKSTNIGSIFETILDKHSADIMSQRFIEKKTCWDIGDGISPSVIKIMVTVYNSCNKIKDF